MAKTKPLDVVKDLGTSTGRLLERLQKLQGTVETTLKDVRGAEHALRDKEKEEKLEQERVQRQERLLQVLSSSDDLAVHVGGDDEVSAKSSEPTIQGKTDDSVPHTETNKPVESTSQPVVEPLEVPTVVAQDSKTPDVSSDALVHEEKAPVAEQESVASTVVAEKTEPVVSEKPTMRDDAKNFAERVARSGNSGRQDRPQRTDSRTEGNRDSRNDNRNGSRTDRPQQNRPGYTQNRGQSDGTRPPRDSRSNDSSGGTQQRSYDRNASGGSTRYSQPAQRSGGGTGVAPTQSKDRASNYDPNKSAHQRTYDADKRAKSKKAKLRESAPAVAWDDDTPMGNRRKTRRQQQMQEPHKMEPVVIEKAILTTETITVKDLSEKIGKPVTEIIKKLFLLGILATINQEIDFDTCELICSEYNIELELQLAKTFEEVLTESADDADDESVLVTRPPVVTIMGHVDHGKTSLLDAIRHSSVTEGEAGGITQHIGAYTVSCNGRPITFIDTPGHEAFTSMRARGAQVTDIVILVVAADDGIMPQTVEAINHSKAAGVPIIVAVNKIDKDGADPERVKQQLTEYGLVVEDWGGDVICVNVSAKKKIGLDSLLEMVLLQADILELKANPDRLAKGTIIEAELHKGRGPIATVLVQNGTLKVGDTIVAGTAYGRVRAMTDDKGRRVTSAGPSCPVQVVGFSEVPAAGDILNVAEVDKLSRQVAQERRDKQKAEMLKGATKVTLDDLFSQISEGQVKELNIIVKADVMGSVEAVKQALEKLSNEEVRVRCIHGGVGAITSTDILFASASNAIIIGFNVRPDSTARAAAEREKVDMRLYRVIYSAIEDVEKAMRGMFAPQYHEVELGRISVRSTFKVSGIGTIAGAYVQDGKVTRNAQVRLVRDGIVIHEGKISSLKRFKDDAKEVAAGYECGIGIEGCNDILEGDIIEAFVIEEVKR